MQCDIYFGEKKVGFLQTQRQGLYTKFYGVVNTSGVAKVYGVFEGGECPLGIPVPEGGRMVLKTSVPTAKLPGGRLLSAHLGERKNSPVRFSGENIGGVCFPAGEKQGNVLLFPWKPGDPFPAEEVMLLYEYTISDGKSYLKIDTDFLQNRSSSINK